MSGAKKLLILSLSVIINSLFISCDSNHVKEEKNQKWNEFVGETQGTTYHIIVADTFLNFNQQTIDSLLHEFDLSLSTYIPESVISRLNNGKDSSTIADPSGFFNTCYNESYEVFRKTNGLFDPSVYPLVEGWGFMKNMETPLNQKSVDSILKFISFEQDKFHRILFTGDDISLNKLHPGFKIDFNAIAQGLSVDVLDRFIASKGHKNYYVEIGGELIVRGKNREGENWSIGIDAPIENASEREIKEVVEISDKAMATSGNYRKFYIKDGKKYAHTLNPKTGFPVEHNLLSATVIADKCSTADAYATAFMVMGKDAAIYFVNNHPELKLEIYLISTDKSGNMKVDYTKGFKEMIRK